MEFEAFLHTLNSKTGRTVNKSGAGYSACCPAHDDHNPSLSIREGSDGKILLKCFAGCPVDAICASLGLTMSDLFESDFFEQQHSIRIAYSYTDEHGRALYRKIRMEPGFNGKSKSFFSERTDDNGNTVQNLQGCRRVLYRLPEVIKAIANGTSIYLVEGEKDADKLVSYGLIATTSSESIKWPDEFTEILKRADVIILYDMDKTGFQRKELLCKKLYHSVLAVSMLNR